MKHAKLSASGSHRWLACPGSVRAEEGISSSSSKFAEEGTTAHSLAELALVKGKSVATVAQDEHPAEMIHAIQQYVDYVRSFEGEHEYEQRVEYTDYVAEGFGTADVIVVSGSSLRLIDLKYGKGVRVDAEHNSQGMLYALGALSEREAFQEITDITICIHQPRLDHISEWSLSVQDLRKFGDDVKRIAKICLSPDAPRVPGNKQCQWCKAKATCKALQQHAENVLMKDFDSMNSLPTEPDILTDEQLRFALDNKKLICGWFDAVEHYVLDKLNCGENFIGYKLVEGRSTRKWSDEKEVADELFYLLGDDSFVKKLITAPQAEKIIGKKKTAELLGKFIVKPVGKPVLVPESDKRNRIVSISADDFDKIGA